MKALLHISILTLVMVVFSCQLAHAAKVKVDFKKTAGVIPSEIFGNNMAWTSFNSYYKSDDKLPDELYASIAELGCPSSRYPGGCYSDTFLWEKSIGPVELRENQWLNACRPPAYESDKAYFGFDEFMQVCEELGAEVLITLQFRPADSSRLIDFTKDYKELTEAGADNIEVVIREEGDKYMVFGDKDDSIDIEFDVYRDGHYELDLSIGKKDGDVDVQDMTFMIDGLPFERDYVKDSEGPDKLSYVAYLRYGKHSLTAVANSPGTILDRFELREMNQDNSIKRAQAWVAYTNGSADDDTVIGVDETGYDWKTVGYWASLRANPDYADREEPYNIKCWEVGNEAWGVDPYGSVPDRDPELYVPDWKKYDEAIRAVDPDARVSICSNSPDSQGGPEQWANIVMKELGDKTDLAHYHPYYPFDRYSTIPHNLYLNGVTAYVGLQTSIDLYRNYLVEHHPSSYGKLKLAASEWAAAYGWDKDNVDWAVRWTGAMCVCDELGTMCKNNDMIESAQYWLIWGGNIGCLSNGTGSNAPHGFYKNTVYHIFRMYNDYFGGKYVPVDVEDVGNYDFAGWGSSMPAGEYPMMTAYAAKSNKYLTVVAINKDTRRTTTTEFVLSGRSKRFDRLRVLTMTAEGEELSYMSRSDADNECVRTDEERIKLEDDDSVVLSLPPCSVTWLIIE